MSWDVDDLSDIRMSDTVVSVPTNYAFKAMNMERRLMRADMAILLASLVTAGLMILIH